MTLETELTGGFSGQGIGDREREVCGGGVIGYEEQKKKKKDSAAVSLRKQGD